MPIFHDPFLDNDNEWEQRDDTSALLRIATGDYAYLFAHRRADREWTTWQPLIIDPDVNYKIHAVIEHVNGADNRGFGIIWRCVDEGNCYSFEVSVNGRYRLRKCINNSWYHIIPWQESEHIRADLNELKIVQLQDKAKLYINEKLVDEQLFLERPSDNGFGFIVSGEQQIRIHSTIVLRHIEWAGDPKPTKGVNSANLEDVLAELNKLVGLDNIKQEVRTFINFLRVQKMRQDRGLATSALNYHMVLAGPPGTGKTTVARLIGKIYKELGLLSQGHLVETDRAGLVAPYVGQTALKVDQIVEKSLGGVLFIDEAYSLMPPKGSQTGQDFGREAIEALLKRMEDHRGNFAVIIAGYANEMDRFLSANSGVKSRFNRYFYFSHYKPNALLEIFEMLVNEGGLFVTDKAKMKLAMGLNKVCQARDETFGNGRFIRNLLEKTIERQANRIVDISPMTDEVLSTIISSDIPSLKEYPIS